MSRFLIAVLTVFSLSASAICQSYLHDPNNPNVVIPPSSVAEPGDAGVRAHTDYMLYAKPRNSRSAAARSMFAPSPGISGYSPAQLKTAYSLPSTGGQGVICIVDAYDYGTGLNDFNVFASQFSLPQETSSTVTDASNQVFQIVYATGSKPLGNASWNGEEALDIEWAHAMAPDAKIVLVEAASSTISDLLTAESVAAAYPGCQEVSNSWGSAEFSGETTMDSSFVQSGVVFFASSGDTAGAQQWPADSPNIVSCGATSLQLNANGSRKSETTWNDGYGGGGGGPSAYEPRPSFQNGIESIVGAARGCPDIASDGDPVTGVAVYDSTSNGGIVGWQVSGGTSAVAPMQAGICNNSNNDEDSSATELALIYGVYGSVNYSTYFYDVTSGTDGSFSAGTGWDYCTGVGVPTGLLNAPQSVQSLAVSPTSVVGAGIGTTGASTGTVTMTVPVRSGSIVVTLHSSSADAQIPTGVTISSGNSANFSIETSPVATQETITLTATYGASSQQATLTVNPVTISSFFASPATLAGGSSTYGYIDISGHALPGGDVVNLTSSSSDVGIPTSATVPAGHDGVAFGITSSFVSSNETITLTASWGASTVHTTITLTPVAITKFFSEATSMVGGNTTYGYVDLAGHAGPSGDVVSLVSGGADLQVPATVTVPAAKDGVTFVVSSSFVSTSEPITVTATLGASVKQMTITLNPVAMTNFFASPANITGGNTTYGYVDLAGRAGSSGDVVSLQSASADAQVPATVTVPAGREGVSFVISSSFVSTTENVTLTATFGSSTKQTTLTLNPVPISSFFTSPSSIMGGKSTYGYIDLAGRAGSSGDVVTIACADPHVTVPASVTVPAGKTGVAFLITTTAVGATDTATLTATLGASTKQTTLTLTSS